MGCSACELAICTDALLAEVPCQVIGIMYDQAEKIRSCFCRLLLLLLQGTHIAQAHQHSLHVNNLHCSSKMPADKASAGHGARLVMSCLPLGLTLVLQQLMHQMMLLVWSAWGCLGSASRAGQGLLDMYSL